MRRLVRVSLIAFSLTVTPIWTGLDAAANHPTPGDTCTADDPRYEPGKPKWRDKQYRYYVNKKTLKPGATEKARAKTYQRILDAHRTWDNTLDDCHYKSKGTWGSVPLGDTDLSAGSRDGKNVWQFVEGPLILRDGDGNNVCSPGAYACTRYRYGTTLFGRRLMKEADVRFDNRRAWGNCYIYKLANCNYDVWGTAAHEIGHVLGLDHHPSVYMTMYRSIADGERDRTLGKADVLGMRRLYGG
jgi:Matrixin